MAESSTFKLAQEALEFLKPKLPEELQKPRIAIICGSGLGGLADTIDPKVKVEFDYGDIPHFPTPGPFGKACIWVPGRRHSRRLNGGKSTVSITPSRLERYMAMRRRSVSETANSFYEGHAINRVTFPVRLFKLLGVEIMIVTNASGALNSEYAVGDVVIINDHIFLAGFAGAHPLRGLNEDEFGVRFPALSDAYDLDLRRTAHRAWAKVIPADSKRRLHEGVYAFCAGPSFETRAECRFMRQLGVDLVGMSTVPEIIVARHSGIRVLALSLVTNNAVLSPVPRGDDTLLQETDKSELAKIVEEGKANHEEVLEAGRQAATDVQKMVRQAVIDMFPRTNN
ncbi:Purine nucleoside phosphorylase [Ophidiomyces ophidiicola]|nr:Purine nucleoside phosphorylase [Ophidiomyces ophidiicola]KAI1941216.1 Purine nucleoside phosphorylase [Ophidiomyces ophidiicola]KAI1962368.1 Purine nucleoside phosphorylase [Ophidiomyces ophidiicola]